MKIIKRTTQYCIGKGGLPKKKKMSPAWESHPSWIMGLDGMTAYHQWVTEVVLPIAFQWIEEHYDEVYALVKDKTMKDDVGVVIAAAFSIVSQMPGYSAGVAAMEKYDEEVKNGTLDPSQINPVWTTIVQKVRDANSRAFHKEAGVLGDTIRAEKPQDGEPDK